MRGKLRFLKIVQDSYYKESTNGKVPFLYEKWSEMRGKMMSKMNFTFKSHPNLHVTFNFYCYHSRNTLKPS